MLWKLEMVKAPKGTEAHWAKIGDAILIHWSEIEVDKFFSWSRSIEAVSGGNAWNEAVILGIVAHK